MALQKKFITVFASVLSASVFFACSESKLDGSPTGTVDANASSSSTSDVGTCNVSNINDIKFVAAENMYYRCDGLTWVQQSSSSVASSSSNTSGVNVFATLEDLPNCTISRENQLAVVSTTNTPYMCTEGRWVVYGTSSISSSSSNVASSSSGTKQSSSSVIVSSSSSTPTLSSSSTPTLSSSSTPIEDPSSSSAECGDEDKVWKAEGGKYYECIDGEWVEGSSSSVESSSSSTSSSSVEKLAWDYLNQDMLAAGKYGELLDNRDGQVYKTIEICDKDNKNCQIWMAENLNYETGNSWCYVNKASNCDKYGRLYTWSAVMDSAAQFSVNAGTKCGYGKTCTPNSPHRGICPEGWHVPTNEEYSTLYTYIGGTSTAGTMLKSTSGWNGSGNGTDKYGFSVLPAGGCEDVGYFYSEGYNAYLWSASEFDSDFAWDQYFDSNDVYADQDYYYLKRSGKSLRCLKDSPDQGGEISSSSIDASSSSSSTPTEDPGSTTAAIKTDGYYKTNCLTCKYATTTDYLNSSKTYGEILDTRDGQVYKTIKICDDKEENCQTWMAQNLNYAYTGVAFDNGYYASDSTSWCYDDDPSNCGTYGRLYTWAAAVDSVAIYKNYGEKCGYGKYCTRFSATVLATSPVRGVCPSGWHLPSNEEWNALYTNVGGTGTAGRNLKANTSLWYSNTGTDEYGFSVLPAGYRGFLGFFYSRGYQVDFWSSTENESSSNNAWRHDYYYDYVDQNYSYKSYGFSVRCLKD